MINYYTDLRIHLIINHFKPVTQYYVKSFEVAAMMSETNALRNQRNAYVKASDKSYIASHVNRTYQQGRENENNLTD